MQMPLSTVSDWPRRGSEILPEWGSLSADDLRRDPMEWCSVVEHKEGLDETILRGWAGSDSAMSELNYFQETLGHRKQEVLT